MHFILADDHALVREGLAQTLKNNIPGLFVTEVADGHALLKSLQANPLVDLVLLDIFMPGTNAFETISAVVEGWPDMPLIIVSAANTPTLIDKTIDLGASGYLAKSISSSEMIRAIQQVLKGGIYVHKPDENNGRNSYQDQPDEYNIYGLQSLTRRQKDVVWLLVQGKSNREIAEFLGVSVHTIKVHVAKIFELLGVSNRTEVLIKLKALDQNIQSKAH